MERGGVAEKRRAENLTFGGTEKGELQKRGSWEEDPEKRAL